MPDRVSGPVEVFKFKFKFKFKFEVRSELNEVRRTPPEPKLGSYCKVTLHRNDITADT